MSHPCCPELLALLDALDGQPPDAVERAVSAHVASCERCAGEERHLDDLLAAVRSSAAPMLPTGLEARLLARLCPPIT
ncbi:MAG: hypothetical protein DCC58_09480 [Chloroflexi bacterium]|nr:MAG: hypothetical protein DCC58_09480 [Chloroflexota bacterium]